MNLRLLGAVLLGGALLCALAPAGFAVGLAMACTLGMLLVVAASLGRAAETRAILSSGWHQYLTADAPAVDGHEVDVGQIAQWCRWLAISAFGLSLAYWVAISSMVDRHLGLAGALLYLAELVMNLELLQHLADHPDTPLSSRATRYVMVGYYVLAAAEGGLLAVTFVRLL